MKKLNLLKTIVDFIWIMSVICYPLILVFATMVIIDNDSIDIPITLIGSTADLTTGAGKIVLVITVLNFGLMLVALYFFRQLLGHFIKRAIFEDVTCSVLNKIGSITLISSVIYLVTDFIADTAKNHVDVRLGYGPFLYLLALGLFFKVLSEVFAIAKAMKEENELTI